MTETLIFNIIIGSAGGREAAKYTALKFHMQCPLVLLVKLRWKEGRAIGSEERTCWEGAAEEMS